MPKNVPERPCGEVAFRRAQWRFIVSSIVVYAFFYLTRKNLSMAQPGMLREGVVSTYALGIIMTIHGVVYGCCWSRAFGGGEFPVRLFVSDGSFRCVLGLERLHAGDGLPALLEDAGPLDPSEGTGDQDVHLEFGPFLRSGDGAWVVFGAIGDGIWLAMVFLGACGACGARRAVLFPLPEGVADRGGGG